MANIYESDIEKLVCDLLGEQGYTYLAPEVQESERRSLGDVLLLNRLKDAIDTINPNIPQEAKEQALRQVRNLPSQNLIDNNEAFHRMLTEGIEVEYMKDHILRGDKVWLVDFDEINNNEFLVCNQFTVIEKNINRRPDVVLFVNGLPLVVIELKNPADEKATVYKAFRQLQNYKASISSLFHYNSVLVASDGFDAGAGTISSELSRFHAWKSSDGSKENGTTTPQIETLIKGMLKKERLLDLIRHFTVFDKTKKEDPETGLTSCQVPQISDTIYA